MCQGGVDKISDVGKGGEGVHEESSSFDLTIDLERKFQIDLTPRASV